MYFQKILVLIYLEKLIVQEDFVILLCAQSLRFPRREFAHCDRDRRDRELQFIAISPLMTRKQVSIELTVVAR